MAPSGVSANDFLEIFNDYKRVVSYKSVTIAIDPMTGQETTTFGTATNQNVIFFLNENQYLFQKSGLTEIGDAYLMVPPSFSIKRYDQFTIDGRKYYVDNLFDRHVMDIFMCKYAVCFLVEK